MMKVVFLALLAQATADTPAKVGCVDACKPPSPVDSHCVTDCQQDMYQCIDETGPNENEEHTKACQDKVLKKYEDLNKEPKKEEEKEEEKKESAAFLQRDFAKLRNIEGKIARIESDSFSHSHPSHKLYHKTSVRFVQRDFAKIEKIAGHSLAQIQDDALSHKAQHKATFVQRNLAQIEKIAGRCLSNIEGDALRQPEQKFHKASGSFLQRDLAKLQKMEAGASDPEDETNDEVAEEETDEDHDQKQMADMEEETDEELGGGRGEEVDEEDADVEAEKSPEDEGEQATEMVKLEQQTEDAEPVEDGSENDA